MPIAAGTRLGPYEVLAQIGAGGMGEVYRARDMNLDREVAIKVLPEALATDPERVARFQREAKTLAALNDPHIATIYGIEEGGGMRALVMELVEGEDLSQRIARGAIPLDEALPIARQIAEALEAAHEAGIIHRDLKPANIKVRSDDTVKVLDFGLAKLVGAGAADGTGRAGDVGALTMSPTITSPVMATGIGVLLGTAAYMSPEQAKGREADKRSDIWAFGCVLYEMLSGRRAFEGDDVTDTLAGILKSDVDWMTVPPDLPPAIRTLLKGCLQKDRRTRIGDVAGVLFVLEHVGDLTERADGPEPVPSSAQNRPDRRLLAGVGVIAATVAVVATVGAGRYLTKPPAPPPLTRFEIAPSPDQGFPGGQGIPRFAVSPDGQSVVYAAGTVNTGPYGLWVRRFDRVDAQPLRSTEGESPNSVQGMFWLPDGKTVGFFDEVGHKLKTVDVVSDTVRTLADVPSNQYAGAANAEGTILYSSLGTNGLMRIPVSGGVPKQVLTLQRGEVAYLWPSYLPDGRHFVYLAQTPDREGWGVFAGSLDAAQRHLLVKTASMGQFVPPDRLLYVRGDALFAQRLDLVGLTLVGDPVLVIQPVPVTLAGRAGFSGSDTGVLAHAANVTGASGVLGPRIPTWVDRSGNEEPLGAPARAYSHVRLSPDGTRVALSASDQQLDVWIWTIARKTLTRLTFDPGEDTNPIWTPDSSRILFQSNLKGSVNLYAVASDGTGKVVQLLDGATGPRTSAVSPDGKDLIFEEDANIGGGADLRALPFGQGGQARTIVGDSSSQRSAAISPDGRWIAYNSNESGGWEVYVRPYPSVEAGRWQVSTGGGSQPVWSRDGKELFYVSSDNALMSIPIDARSTWTAGTPSRLQIARGLVSSQSALAPQGWTYDVSLDGRRFLVLKSAAPEQPEASVRIVVVLNWMRSGLGAGK